METKEKVTVEEKALAALQAWTRYPQEVREEVEEALESRAKPPQLTAEVYAAAALSYIPEILRMYEDTQDELNFYKVLWKNDTQAGNDYAMLQRALIEAQAEIARLKEQSK